METSIRRRWLSRQLLQSQITELTYKDVTKKNGPRSQLSEETRSPHVSLLDMSFRKLVDNKKFSLQEKSLVAMSEMISNGPIRPITSEERTDFDRPKIEMKKAQIDEYENESISLDSEEILRLGRRGAELQDQASSLNMKITCHKLCQGFEKES